MTNIKTTASIALIIGGLIIPNFWLSTASMLAGLVLLLTLPNRAQ